MLVSVALRDHIEPLRYLGAELLGRGYAVSLAIPEEAREWLLADGLGFNLVVTGSTATAMRERPVNLTVDPTLRRISNAVQSSVTNQWRYLKEMYAPLLAAAQRNRPDIIVADRSAWAGVAVAEQLGVPLIVNSPQLLLDLDDPPFAVPAPFTTDLTPLLHDDLLGRARNLLGHLKFAVESYSFAAHAATAGSFELGVHATEGVASSAMRGADAAAAAPAAVSPLAASSGDPSVSVDSSAAATVLALATSSNRRRRDVVLCNTVFGLEHPRDLPPRIRMVGPIAPLATEQAPRRLIEWLDSSHRAERAVVVLYFDEQAALDQWHVAALSGALVNNRRVRTLWLTADSMRQLLPDSLGPSVRWSPLVSLHALMAHDASAVLVTRGGSSTVQAALWSGKPALMLPLLAEQWEFAGRVASIGAGLAFNLSGHADDEARLAHALEQVISNQSIIDSARRLSHIMHASGGRQEAADVVELVFHGGTAHFLPISETLPWVQAFLIDVAAAYTIGITLLALFVKLSKTAVWWLLNLINDVPA